MRLKRIAKDVGLLSLVCLCIGLGQVFRPPYWRIVTAEEISRVVDPALRSPNAPSQSVYKRSKRVDRLVAAFHWSLMGNEPRLSPSQREIENRRFRDALSAELMEGPAKCSYEWGVCDRTWVGGRDNGGSHGYPPLFFAGLTNAFGATRETLSLIQQCALREGQAISRLDEVSGFLFDQTEADKEVNSCIDQGKLSAGDAEDLLRTFFTSEEIEPGIRRAAVGEFWNFDVKNILNPLQADNLGRSFRGREAQRRGEGSFDGIRCARDISGLYSDFLRNCNAPPVESRNPWQAQIGSQVSLLPFESLPKIPGWRGWLASLLYQRDLNTFPNSYGVLYVEYTAPFDVFVSQSERADCQALHRLLAVKLAAYAFHKRIGRRPADLKELVRIGSLKEIPADPYSHGPLSFDPLVGSVFSVGNPPTLGANSLLRVKKLAIREGKLEQLDAESLSQRPGLSFLLP